MFRFSLYTVRIYKQNGHSSLQVLSVSELSRIISFVRGVEYKGYILLILLNFLPDIFSSHPAPKLMPLIFMSF